MTLLSPKVGERNRKEAEILTGNLGDQLIPQHEILADSAQLRTLAHLQESLVSWSTWKVYFIHEKFCASWADQEM